MERIVAGNGRGHVEQEYLSVNEAAIYAGVGHKLIRSAIISCELKGTNLGTAKKPLYRTARKSVDDWMNGKQVKAAPSNAELNYIADHYFKRTG